MAPRLEVAGWKLGRRVKVAGVATLELSTTAAQATSFMNLLGPTSSDSDGDASLGNYFNAAVSHSTYLCISNGGCIPVQFHQRFWYQRGKSSTR